IIFQTLLARLGLTVGTRLMARETVAVETLARFAISLISMVVNKLRDKGSRAMAILRETLAAGRRTLVNNACWYCSDRTVCSSGAKPATRTKALWRLIGAHWIKGIDDIYLVWWRARLGRTVVLYRIPDFIQRLKLETKCLADHYMQRPVRRI